MLGGIGRFSAIREAARAVGSPVGHPDFSNFHHRQDLKMRDLCGRKFTIKTLPSPVTLIKKLSVNSGVGIRPHKLSAHRTKPALPMKTNASIFRSLAAVVAMSALAHPGAQAQTSATDPVGFVTLNISGTGGTIPIAYTFTSLALQQPVAFQSTTTSVGGSTILADAGASWTNNQYNSTTTGAPPTHYVEILSGPGAGTIYDIVTTDGTAKTLTLGSSLAVGITSGASYRIRPHWTIAGVFGTANQVGLGSGSAATADQIQLFRNGGYVGYFYQTAGRNVLQNAWVSASDLNTDAGNTVIYPGDGIVIARKQSGSLSLVLNGAVKTGQTSLPVLSGYCLLGNVYASGMTLSNSGLYTGDGATGLAAGSAATADQVVFWNGTGFVSYFYQTSGRNVLLNAWVSASDLNTDAGNTAIPAGTALFIKRSGAPFNWVAPQFPATFN